MNGIGNAWHNPSSFEPRSTSRDPLAGIFNASSVAIFSSTHFQGSGGEEGQLAITSAFFFKRRYVGAQFSVPMRFDTARGNNKHYVAALRVGVEYHQRIPFSDHLTIFIHRTDSGSLATASEAITQAAPFEG